MATNAPTRKEVAAFVFQGNWTPKRAEAWAKRQGLPPFAGVPDPNNYAPENEAYWSVFMVLAWIIYRDLSKVRQVWPEYVREIKYWNQRVEIDGEKYWELVSGSCTFDFYDDKCFVVEPAAARNELRLSLISGTLNASGINCGRRNIVREEWIDLPFFDVDHVGANIDCDIYMPVDGITLGPTFSRVLMSVKDVLAAYPPANEISANAATLSRPATSAPLGKQAGRTKTETAADLLKQLFPDARPALNRGELMLALKVSSPTIGSFSTRTLTRAIALVWPTDKPKLANR